MDSSIQSRPRLAAAFFASTTTSLLFTICLMLAPSVAMATPFAAFTSHVGETHTSEDHKNEYLEGINLTSADLTATSFKNANLKDAIFVSATLDNVEFKGAAALGADFTNASMVNAEAKNADFTNAIFDGVDFATAGITNAVFVGASLLGADLRSVVDWSSADFTNATYDGSTLLPDGFDTSSMNMVPEPSSALLLALGLLGLEAYGQRLKRREVNATTWLPAASPTAAFAR